MILIPQELLKDWEESKSGGGVGYDATEVLHKMANLLEKETHVYMARY